MNKIASRFLLSLCLATLLLLSTVPRAQASPYYKVTDLGPYDNVSVQQDSTGQRNVSIWHPSGTSSFPFPQITNIPLTATEQANLPKSDAPGSLRQLRDLLVADTRQECRRHGACLDPE